ncbi:hypothetical protein MRX96_009266 [Rhipicephalus microplus]
MSIGLAPGCGASSDQADDCPSSPNSVPLMPETRPLGTSGEPRLEERSSTMPFCAGQPVWLEKFPQPAKMVAGSGHQYPRGSGWRLWLCRTASNVVMRTNCGCALRRTRTRHSQGALQHPPPPLTKPRRCQPAWLTPRRRGRRPLANLRHRRRSPVQQATATTSKVQLVKGGDVLRHASMSPIMS